MVMINYLLICDSHGFTHFNKAFTEKYNKLDYDLFGGFLSALTQVGNALFQKTLAKVLFGENLNEIITIITKEFFDKEYKIYFIFLTEKDIPFKKLRGISDGIYIHIRALVCNNTANRENGRIEEKVNNFLTNLKFEDNEEIKIF